MSRILTPEDQHKAIDRAYKVLGEQDFEPGIYMLVMRELKETGSTDAAFGRHGEARWLYGLLNSRYGMASIMKQLRAAQG